MEDVDRETTHETKESASLTISGSTNDAEEEVSAEPALTNILINKYSIAEKRSRKGLMSSQHI